MTAKDAILFWLKKNPMVFQFRLDNDVITLIEMSSKKQLSINTDRIETFRFTPHPQGWNEYLNLILTSGKEVILCHAGFAFAPSFASTGELPDAPPVSCLTDYERLLLNLKAIRSDSTQKPAALLLFNVLISILDGAREIGLDVGPEEEALDKQLTEFEKGIK